MAPRIKLILLALLPLVVLVTAAAISNRRTHLPCNDYRISIFRSGEVEVLREADIRQRLIDFLDTVPSTPQRQLNLQAVEQRIARWPSVKETQVYTGIDGLLHIDITERQPVLRVFNSQGQTAWVDYEGYVMPVARHTPARLLCATGRIDCPLEPGTHIEDSLLQGYPLKDLYQCALTISSDSFLQAQVQQLHVNEKMQLTLVPRVGNHTIVLGNAAQLEDKFLKLKLLYSKGLTLAEWNSFSTIDLTFQDQIVCTRK